MTIGITVGKTQAGFMGADWVVNNCHCEMSDLGHQVADLLGDIHEGIYHLNYTSLKKTDWSDKNMIDVTLDITLATVDSNLLTRLVVLCHDRMLRLSIEGRAFRYLLLRFSQRTTREEGEFWKRCPTLENHIQSIREYYDPNFGGKEYR